SRRRYGALPIPRHAGRCRTLRPHGDPANRAPATHFRHQRRSVRVTATNGKSNKKKAHLLGFIQHGVNSHATGMWRHPKDKVGWNFARPEYWRHMARTMERGLFDAMFIADEL